MGVKRRRRRYYHEKKNPRITPCAAPCFFSSAPRRRGGLPLRVPSWPSGCWKQFFCDHFGIGCGDQTPGTPSEPEQPSEPEEPSEPEQPPKPSGGTSVSSYEQQVVTLVNAERAKYGLAALTLDETLCGYARVKSQDMHDQGYFSHTSPTYGSPFDMMRSFGVSYRSAGENIAMGYSTPEAVVAAWMNSAGHRANILSANYTTLGVGYVEDGGYWTQWFIG